MSKQAGNGPLRLQHPLQSCAMDMICGEFESIFPIEFPVDKFRFLLFFQTFTETTLGYSIHSQSNENSEFLQRTHVILDVTARRFFQPWIQPSFLFRLSKFSKPYHSCVNYLNKFLEDVCLD